MSVTTQQDSGSRERPTWLLLADVAAGGGMGLLVGVLLGLSVAQAVGGVIAALSALIGGFLGLTGGGDARSWRTAAFGVACVTGVLLGLFVRSGAVLAPSIEQDVAQWQRAGFSKEQALSFVAFARLGIKPAGTEMTPRPATDATSNVLFADRAGVCARLQRLPAPAQLRILTETGEAYAALAAAAQAAPDQPSVLSAGLASLCG
jgi:MFS family permease